MCSTRAALLAWCSEFTLPRPDRRGRCIAVQHRGTACFSVFKFRGTLRSVVNVLTVLTVWCMQGFVPTAAQCDIICATISRVLARFIALARAAPSPRRQSSARLLLGLACARLHEYVRACDPPRHLLQRPVLLTGRLERCARPGQPHGGEARPRHGARDHALSLDEILLAGILLRLCSMPPRIVLFGILLPLCSMPTHRVVWHLAPPVLDAPTHRVVWHLAPPVLDAHASCCLASCSPCARCPHASCCCDCCSSTPGSSLAGNASRGTRPGERC